MNFMAQELAEIDQGAGNAVATTAAQGGFASIMAALRPGQIIALGTVTVLLLAFFAFIIFRATSPNYAILYSNLTIDDAQMVTDRLGNLGVPFQLSDSGDAVLVPSDQILQLRMDLASEGIPAGGTAGYEIFDESSSLTATDFISNVNLRRALEGELARTIMSLRQVRSARVHIVSPARQPFSRTTQQPTASVVVGTTELSKKQISGIRHLVASAVPGMSAGQVSILDDNGNLLASPDDENELIFGQRHEEQRITLENRLRDKIIALLERSVGRDRVDAQVSAEMNFDAITTTTEEFDPEGQVARSVQTIEETSDLEETDIDQAVTVQNNLPAEGQDEAGGPTSTERSNRTEENTNFEISRTVQSQTRVGGDIERLSVAVQVDFRDVVDDAGNVTRVPRDADDLEQIESLVRSAVGFDEERGDWIEVVTREFAIEEPVELVEPGMFDFTKSDIWRAGELLALLILGIVGVIFGVKPLLAYGFGLGKEPEDEANDGDVIDGILDANGNPIPLIEDNSEEPMEIEDEIDDFVDVLGVDGKVRASLVDKVSEIIENNPEAGVRVLRNWLHGG